MVTLDPDAITSCLSASVKSLSVFAPAALRVQTTGDAGSRAKSVTPCLGRGRAADAQRLAVSTAPARFIDPPSRPPCWAPRTSRSLCPAACPCPFWPASPCPDSLQVILQNPVWKPKENYAAGSKGTLYIRLHRDTSRRSVPLAFVRCCNFNSSVPDTCAFLYLQHFALFLT